jgi:hypothetical protein
MNPPPFLESDLPYPNAADIAIDSEDLWSMAVANSRALGYKNVYEYLGSDITVINKNG